MASYRSRSDEDACSIILNLKRRSYELRRRLFITRRGTTRDEIEHVECILFIASYPFVIFIQLKGFDQGGGLVKSGRKQIDRSRIKSDNLHAIFISLNNWSIFDWINFNRIFPRWIIIPLPEWNFWHPPFFILKSRSIFRKMAYTFIKFNRILKKKKKSLLDSCNHRQTFSPKILDTQLILPFIRS